MVSARSARALLIVAVAMAGSTQARDAATGAPAAGDEGYLKEHWPQARTLVWARPGETGTEFHLAHGDWIRLLRATGFEVEDLIELQAPADAMTHGYYDFVSAEWARRWPAEEMWVARLHS